MGSCVANLLSCKQLVFHISYTNSYRVLWYVYELELIEYIVGFLSVSFHENQ